MEELAAPACVIDRDGRYLWLNRAYIELFGDRRGQPFVDAIVPEQRSLARTNFARKVVGKTTLVYDLQEVDRPIERLNGVVRWLALNVGSLDRHDWSPSSIPPGETASHFWPNAIIGRRGVAVKT